MMMIQGRYILRNTTNTVASKTVSHLITINNNRRRLVSTAATPALLQSFKYDAPWIHYNNNTNEQQPTIKNFINGTFEEVTETATHNKIPIYDPSTNNVLSYVAESTTTTNTNISEENNNALQRAVTAAKNAYPKWSNTPVQTRQRLLLDYAHLLHRKEVREEIA